jgi:hypothetical protein
MTRAVHGNTIAFGSTTPRRSRALTLGRAAAIVVVGALSTSLCAVIVGRSAQSLAGNRMAPWILGRAAGLTSYLLLVVLVLAGLGLSHPWRTRVRWPVAASRIRIHIILAVLTLSFTALHVVALATDRYAGLGWAGALLPMHASYRPVATTLGLIGAWSGLLAGITAASASRLPLRLWWPIHKVAGIALVFIWLHGALGGSDNTPLLPLYLSTAGLVLITAASRYLARTPVDLMNARGE